MVVFEQQTMLIINIVLLAAGPIAVGILILVLHRQNKLLWTREGWIRFPLASITATVATGALAFLYSKLSPYVSNPFVLTAFKY